MKKGKGQWYDSFAMNIVFIAQVTVLDTSFIRPSDVIVTSSIDRNHRTQAANPLTSSP